MNKRERVLLIFLCLSVVGVIWLETSWGWRMTILAPPEMPTSQQLQAAFSGNARQTFEDSREFVLLSLDPVDMGGYQGHDSFHGYRIVGQARVDSQTKARLITALYQGMADKAAWRFACFSPRHGIRAIRGREVVDLVICFHCHQFLTYPGTGNYPAISDAAQPIFDQTLRENGVPLSPD